MIKDIRRFKIKFYKTKELYELKKRILSLILVLSIVSSIVPSFATEPINLSMEKLTKSYKSN